MGELKYKRIMLKVSGEALAGQAHRGLDFDVIHSVCESIRACVDMGVQVGLMVGAGNFWRGVKDGADRMQRSHADAMGLAEQAREILKESFPNAFYDILPLSPAFITQGGPGCVAVQVVKP